MWSQFYKVAATDGSEIFRFIQYITSQSCFASLVEFQRPKGHIAKKHLGTYSCELKQEKSQSYHFLQPSS